MITLLPNKLSGAIQCPPSKSLAHRAIICASLARGISVLSGLEYSDDIIATIEAMRQLGAYIETNGDTCVIEGHKFKPACERIVDCNESGSTLRFLTPISTLFEGSTTFIGRGNLGKRPLTTFYEIFDRQGIEYHTVKEQLNLKINGSLYADNFEVAGNISSQFISGLMFTLPLLEGDSTISIVGDLESRGYIDLTLDMLEKFNIHIKNDNYQKFYIQGNQTYCPQNYQIEGDYSQAAFFLVANALGNTIDIKGLNPKSRQGDKVVIDIIDKLLDSKNECVEIDASPCPDVIPVVSLLACSVSKDVHIINAGRLRIKECDRLNATCQALAKLGADIVEEDNSIRIRGGHKLKGASVSSFADHRMAMMMAVASTVVDGNIELDNHTCVSKSFPSFWEVFKSLGGKFHE